MRLLLPSRRSPAGAGAPRPMSESREPDLQLERPDDNRAIEDLFGEVMRKRGWNNLPDYAINQMLLYPAEKKWSLIYQDRLTEWEAQRRRTQRAAQRHEDGSQA
ncbi:hypothetical protein OQA88_5093 [Cercophora sp. LCS_1]